MRVVDTFPEASHAPIVYPAAVVTDHDTPAARKLLGLLHEPATQAIFRRYGFDAPPQYDIRNAAEPWLSPQDWDALALSLRVALAQRHRCRCRSRWRSRGCYRANAFSAARSSKRCFSFR